MSESEDDHRGNRLFVVLHGIYRGLFWFENKTVKQGTKRVEDCKSKKPPVRESARSSLADVSFPQDVLEENRAGNQSQGRF